MLRDWVPDWSVLPCRFRAFSAAALQRDGLPVCSVLYKLGQGFVAESVSYQDNKLTIFGANGIAIGTLSVSLQGGPVPVIGLVEPGSRGAASSRHGYARSGATSLAYTWWLFASAAHRNLFISNPEHCAAQYDDHCRHRGEVLRRDTATSINRGDKN